MKIFHKLLIGFLAMAILIGCVGTLSFFQLRDIEFRVKQLGESSVIEFELADRMLTVLESCQLSAFEFANLVHSQELFPFSPRNRDEMVHDIRADLHDFSGLLENVINATEVAIHLAQSYNDSQTAASEREELETMLYPLQGIFEQYKASLLDFIRMAEVDFSMAIENFAVQVENQTFKQMRILIEDIREDAREEMHSEISEILDDHILGAIRIVLGATVLGFILATVFGHTLARGISNPIIALEAAALRVAGGRLDVRVDSEAKDEIGVLGRSFNQMLADLDQTTVSKEFLDNVIETMLDALIVTTPDLTIKMVNGAVCRLGGYGKAELTGKPLSTIIAPMEPGSSIYDQLQINMAVKNVELAFVTKQARQIPILVSATILHEDNRVDSIVCVARDIHERKEAEVQLQKAHDELEERVKERTFELAQSEKQLRRLSYSVLKAQEDERKRLANELHDELGQSLSLLKMQMAALQRKLPPRQDALQEEFQEVRGHFNQVIEDVRRLSQDLSPAALDDLGLSAALRKIGDDFAKYYPATVSFEATDMDQLFSQDTQIVIYRIFQEIFTNIGKHAQASHVQVTICLDNDNVLMAVQDDGQGFDPAETPRPASEDRGLGLASLHERARMIHADLDLWSQAGRGTRLSFTIPIHNGEFI
jgi:PAS domain S-box-containing protein